MKRKYGPGGARGFWSRGITDEQYRERLRSRCKVEANGCWLYQGFRHPNGYGDMSYRNQSWRVHRLAFLLWKGPIPDGHYICHTCDTPHCVNPEHLFSGTQKDNMVDAKAKKRVYWGEREACSRGHKYADGNYYLVYCYGPQPVRRCKICERGIQRLRAGWPEDLAFSLPAQKLGYKPTGIGSWKHQRKQRKRRAVSAGEGR